VATGRNLWSAIRSCTAEHWRSAGKWFAYTVGCGFLPIVIGFLLVLALSSTPNWYDFVVHGELVIYSAALVASSTRLISKDTDPLLPFVHREMFTLIAIISIVASIALYSAIKVATFLKLQATIDNAFIARFSIPLLIFSLAFSFIVFLLDQQRVSPDVRGISKHKEKELSDAFDNLGGAA
jgi:hypothetical protein